MLLSLNRLQRVYDILKQLGMIPESKNITQELLNLYQQEKFDVMIDGLSCTCEDCLSSKIRDNISYSYENE